MKDIGGGSSILIDTIVFLNMRKGDGRGGSMRRAGYESMFAL